jgi:nitrite reductase (NO-forming)
MAKGQIKKTTKNISIHITTIRVIFGLIWVIDAVLKWLPGFRKDFMMEIMGAAQNQPHWLNWWFNFWMNPMMNHAQLFAYLTAVIESLIAVAVLIGFARKSTYISAAVFSILIWGIGEGFGGPYVSGATDIGTGIIYAVVFYALYQLERAVPNSWSADRYIARVLPWWHVVANP